MVFFSIVYPNHRNKCDSVCWFFLVLFHFMLNHIAMYQFTESIQSDFFSSFWSCGLFKTFNPSNKRALSSENSSVDNSRAQKHLNPEKKFTLIHQNANFCVRWLIYMGIQIESPWCFVEICINVKLIYKSHTIHQTIKSKISSIMLHWRIKMTIILQTVRTELIFQSS